MAITSGMNILTNSNVYAGLSGGHFLSPTGNCMTWDVAADDYCRSDSKLRISSLLKTKVSGTSCH